MRDETVARNYAEALFELAARHEGPEVYGEALDEVARLLDEEPSFRSFVKTPRVSAAEKKKVVRRAFEGRLPEPFVNFLLVTIDKRRQRLLRQMALQYHELLDEHMNRVHVDVTVARPLADDLRSELASRLSTLLGKTALPHVRVDPAILGGVVVRTGDTVFDGSLRRRMDGMRRQLLSADLPARSGGEAEGEPPTA